MHGVRCWSRVFPGIAFWAWRSTAHPSDGPTATPPHALHHTPCRPAKGPRPPYLGPLLRSQSPPSPHPPPPHPHCSLAADPPDTSQPKPSQPARQPTPPTAQEARPPQQGQRQRAPAASPPEPTLKGKLAPPTRRAKICGDLLQPCSCILTQKPTPIPHVPADKRANLQLYIRHRACLPSRNCSRTPKFPHSYRCKAHRLPRSATLPRLPTLDTSGGRFFFFFLSIHFSSPSCPTLHLAVKLCLPNGPNRRTIEQQHLRKNHKPKIPEPLNASAALTCSWLESIFFLTRTRTRVVDIRRAVNSEPVITCNAHRLQWVLPIY